MVPQDTLMLLHIPLPAPAATQGPVPSKALGLQLPGQGQGQGSPRQGLLSPGSQGTPHGTSSMMSPFSACTWAMAPRSRRAQKISYICRDTVGAGSALPPPTCSESGPGFPCLLGSYLAISALQLVLVSHEHQERVHTLKKENDTCGFVPLSLPWCGLGRGDWTRGLCWRGLLWKQSKVKG